MSYVSSYFHCVFGTKERHPLITPALEPRLFQYLGGIARENDFKLLEANGIADHIHILILTTATLPISKAVQLLKGGSSKWIHDTFPDLRHFSWGEKYGAFSVSVSQLDVVTRYIRNQKEHHKAKSFEDEFLALLKNHNIQYDPKYLWT